MRDMRRRFTSIIKNAASTILSCRCGGFALLFRFSMIEWQVFFGRGTVMGRYQNIGNTQAHAVRAFFFIGGFGSASWAPLVPLLRERLSIGDDVLGMLLLCVGIGSLVTMPLAGAVIAAWMSSSPDGGVAALCSGAP